MKMISSNLISKKFRPTVQSIYWYLADESIVQINRWRGELHRKHRESQQVIEMYPRNHPT